MTADSARTWNKARSYASPDTAGGASGRLALFFKALRGLSPLHLYQHLRNSAREDVNDTIILALHLRDCRGGKGERELGRLALQWIFVNYNSAFMRVLPLIQEYGRWDDLLHFFPGALDLKDGDRLRGNFDSTITDGQLEALRVSQNDVVDVVIDRLKEDAVKMAAGEPCSLLAKWLPTEKSSMDREHSLVKTICSRMQITPKEYRKVYVSPLRTHLDVVERKMCAGDWEEINFSHVPSCAMRRLKKAFQKHDAQRYANWVESLKRGETTVKAKQLFPHELVSEVLSRRGVDDVTEEQWKVLEAEVESMGSMENTLVVADVSGSMFSGLKGAMPIAVSVALALLSANSVKGVFHNHVITFSNTPKFFVVKDGSLASRVNQVKTMEWGMNTDFCAVHRLILEQASRHNLTQEDMPACLLCVSDMQFDQATNLRGHGTNTTNHDAMRQMYEEAGYTMPQLVYWNVNGATGNSDTGFPVGFNDDGVALISGFSPSILRHLLRTTDLNPYNVMRTTIDSDRYAPVREALE